MSFFVRSKTVFITSSDVAYPLITSTSFITGTGFMKCIPITFSGLWVCEAIFVIDIEDVFVASIADGLQSWSSSLKILHFKSTFSVAASITISAFCTPSPKDEKELIFFNVFSLSVAVIFSFTTIRSRFLEIVSKPFFNASEETSTRPTL